MPEDILETKALIANEHEQIHSSSDNNCITEYLDGPLTRNCLATYSYNNDSEEEEPEESPFLVSGHHIDDGQQQTSDAETLIHLIKGNIGTGILAMPNALKNSGLYTGMAVLPIIATVTCKKELKERTGIVNFDYADVAEIAFRTSTTVLQPLGLLARKIIIIFLVLTQMGFCCVYVVFIVANVKQVIDCKFPESNIDIHGYMAIILVPLLFISMVRSLKVLAPFSLMSNFFLILGLAISFYYILQDLPSSFDRKEFSSWETFPLFLGTSIYAFEGIGVVLPLERNMINSDHFRGCSGVLNTAMILVSCGYIAVGFFGYLKYGDAVHGSITLNLPPADNLAQLVKILMAGAIYLTYPLMLYVPVHVMWPSLRLRFTTRGSRKLGEYSFRALLVFVTFVLAAVIPNIGLFISLVGAVASAALAIIFPPIIEVVTFWPRVSTVTLVKCVSFVLFGLVCFVTGTFASLSSIVEYFHHWHEPTPALIC